MSGFVVVQGAQDAESLRKSFARIRHRGPFLSGMDGDGSIRMAQNYLQADCPGADPETSAVPLRSNEDGRTRICYDGQMGNAAELGRAAGCAPGPFLEERLILKLYADFGSKMLDRLNDAIFAFVISDGEKLFAARDVFGIKTMFYGRVNGSLYLTSELKSLKEVTDDVNEFPPGHFMDGSGRLTRFASLPEAPPETWTEGADAIARRVYEIIERSVRARVDFARPTACLLSGGMDSSAIAHIAAQIHREHFGDGKRLKSYAIGSRDSGDLPNARLMAEQAGTDHEELVMDLDLLLDVLPEVIYSLESFDPSLVRSAAANFLISRHAAREGYEVLLSGEGGDEIFCGYTYLKDFPAEELFARQMECIGYLHNNASLRLDRANLWNSVRVVAPLISGELFEYALGIPPEYKQRPMNGKKVEKWIFRKAFAEALPGEITERLKQEFSQGSGSAGLLPDHFETVYSDDELAEARSKHPLIRSKEELHYFRLFTDRFGEGKAVATVGQWKHL
ncbi:MAG: hypothetical protein GF355_07540 [Candidatus Eisenbacteria bacterium]|nr:hypothetical protein [Candidatus Eisenbacteria bacterium]